MMFMYQRGALQSRTRQDPIVDVEDRADILWIVVGHCERERRHPLLEVPRTVDGHALDLRETFLELPEERHLVAVDLIEAALLDPYLRLGERLLSPSFPLTQLLPGTVSSVRTPVDAYSR